MAANTATTKQGSKEPTVDDLGKQIDTLKADIAKLTGLMSEFGSAKATEAREMARNKARELRSEGERYAEEAGRVVHENAEAALDAVRRQPATAIAMSVGIGFLIGLVASSRR